MHPWTFYALEVAKDREREQRQRRLLSEVHSAQPAHPSRVRHSAAMALASLSRGSAAAVRRLDDCVADDLGRALAPTD
jgi:hypothetical protein